VILFPPLFFAFFTEKHGRCTSVEFNEFTGAARLLLPPPGFIYALPPLKNIDY